MKIDHKRLERQEEGVNKWFNSSKYGAFKDMCGTLNYFTGVGKTFTAILIIKRLFRIFNNHNVVVLVPSDPLRVQWKKQLEKHLLKKDLIKINIFTPHYIISNDLRITTHTLVVDELDAFYSEKFVNTINGNYIKYSNNLSLTATYEDNLGREKLIINTHPIIDKISEKEALEKGYISPYIEFNLAVELTKEEKELYDKYTKIISENINKFGKKGIELAQKCLSGGKHKGIKKTNIQFVYGWAVHKGWHKNLNLENPVDIEINNLWNPHKVIGYAVKLMKAIKDRKNVLYNAEIKYEVIKNILSNYPNKKAIIFSQSTSFADNMNNVLNINGQKSVVYHSNLVTELLPSEKTGKLIKFGKGRKKKAAIKAITSGKAMRLCTASSLDKGLDVPDLMIGITASGTSGFTQYQQRNGRTKRLFGEDKLALLINLYVKNSKEETWLSNRQSKTIHSIHWINSLNEITYDKRNNKIFNIEEI